MVIYDLTLVVVNLPVKFDDEVAALDFASEIFTLLPTTLTVVSIKLLSDVIELVTVACAVVPFEAHTIVTSNIWTLLSSLSIVTSVLEPLKLFLSNATIVADVGKDAN